MNFFEWLRRRWVEFRGGLSSFMERLLNRLAAWLHRICATFSDERLRGLFLIMAHGTVRLIHRDEVRHAMDQAVGQAGLDDAARWRLVVRMLRGVCAEEEFPVSRDERPRLVDEVGDEPFLVELG
ncbi:MAG: hypothetical protein V7637_4143 [Mycobacteriales bacterium]